MNLTGSLNSPWLSDPAPEYPYSPTYWSTILSFLLPINIQLLLHAHSPLTTLLSTLPGKLKQWGENFCLPVSSSASAHLYNLYSYSSFPFCFPGWTVHAPCLDYPLPLCTSYCPLSLPQRHFSGLFFCLSASPIFSSQTIPDIKLTVVSLHLKENALLTPLHAPCATIFLFFLSKKKKQKQKTPWKSCLLSPISLLQLFFKSSPVGLLPQPLLWNFFYQGDQRLPLC